MKEADQKMLHTAQIQACDSLGRQVHYRSTNLISGYQESGEGFMKQQRLSRDGGYMLVCVPKKGKTTQHEVLIHAELNGW